MTVTLRPTSELMGVGWLTLALPGVGVGTRLPAADDAMRANGFVRVGVVGGHPDVYTPRRSPVIVAECWVPPAEGSYLPPWNQAGQLAQSVVDATQDRALQDVVVDVTGLVLDGATLPAYPPGRVMTVVALGEPRRVEDDPNNWARLELDLSLFWLPAT